MPHAVVLALYALTMFVGATLLFVVQPMVGKMILPLLGGTPAVWSTCMVFFQGALLGGYAYAHATAARLSASRQALVHLVVLAVPLAVLPLGVSPALVRGGESSPVVDVLRLLAVSVGLPFLAVSATAPLLQKWFSQTGHPAAADPYFLYAASNLGSMLALLGYPTLIEPRLELRDRGGLSQTELWTAGYVLLIVLIGLCALALRRSAPPGVPVMAGGSAGTGEALAAPAGFAGAVPAEAPLGAARRLRWIALSFVPSSLLLGVTTYATTDIAAVPLLWVVPLAVYLLTFILVFGRWPARLHGMVLSLALPAALVVLFLIVSGYRPRIWLTLLLHLLLLFVVSLACHGELALDRPAARRLTEFYLLISVGGVLGGAFNALLAPVAFSSLAEYPLAMIAAAALLAGRRAGGAGVDRRALALDLAVLVGVIALAMVLYSGTIRLRVDFGFATRLFGIGTGWVDSWLDPSEVLLNRILRYGAPLLAAALLLRRRPMFMAVGLVAALAIVGFVDARNEEQMLQARSFFGVLRVGRDREENEEYVELRHGTTLHGRQSLDPKRRAEPVSYYRRGGPVSQVFEELDRRPGSRRVAVIGLGTGTLAAYARPGDAITFYEIDRLVRDIAMDRAYFTFVSDARDRGASIRVDLGDARIRLEAVRRERPGERYDLIAVDAFSSDAIPVHLLTREAIRLYLDMLKPDGVLTVHISNRYLQLAPVVANLAQDAGLRGRLIQEDDASESKGAASSTWTVLARSPEALGALPSDPRWTRDRLEGDPRVGVWTDDFHNLLAVFRWH
jgi:hypothetical protein